MTAEVDPRMMTQDEIVKRIKERQPDLWKLLYPRIYDSVPKCGSYCSSKLPAVYLATVCLQYQKGTEDKSVWVSYNSAYDLINHTMPMFWVGADLAEAVKLTAPPMDIEWATMPLPFESGILMLPKQTLEYRGNDASYLIWHRYKYGNDTGFAVSVGFDNGPGNVTQVIGTQDLGSKVSLQALVDYVLSTPVENPLNPDDPDACLRFVAEVMPLLFGIFAAMLARPELVTPATCKRTVKAKHGESAKQFWSPNVIGERYVLQRPAIHESGIHTAPRFHWVRGHWRNQACGTSRADHRLIWIEPFVKGVQAEPEKAA